MIMDLKLDIKTVKAGGVVLAALIGIAGVAAHFLGHDYISLGLIVLAAFVIFASSLLQYYLFKYQQIKDID
jgi:hypothetical protein